MCQVQTVVGTPLYPGPEVYVGTPQERHSKTQLECIELSASFARQTLAFVGIPFSVRLPQPNDKNVDPCHTNVNRTRLDRWETSTGSWRTWST